MNGVFWPPSQASVFCPSRSPFGRCPRANALSWYSPPLPEQERIAGILREQMAAVAKAPAAAEAELETIDALPAALLRRVFGGELQRFPDPVRPLWYACTRGSHTARLEGLER